VKGEKTHPGQQAFYAPNAKMRATTVETSVVLATSANAAPSVVVSTQYSLILGAVVEPFHEGT
jgi:hypothetical protein